MSEDLLKIILGDDKFTPHIKTFQLSYLEHSSYLPVLGPLTEVQSIIVELQFYNNNLLFHALFHLHIFPSRELHLL